MKIEAYQEVSHHGEIPIRILMDWEATCIQKLELLGRTVDAQRIKDLQDARAYFVAKGVKLDA